MGHLTLSPYIDDKPRCILEVNVTETARHFVVEWQNDAQIKAVHDKLHTFFKQSASIELRDLENAIVGYMGHSQGRGREESCLPWADPRKKT